LGASGHKKDLRGELNHKSPFRHNLTFKGGTSLSKCFGLIRRFSEDIDLILDWRLLGYEKDEPWTDRSKTKQDTFNKEANSRAEVFLADVFLPTFSEGISDIIGEEAKTRIEQADPQTISFYYPQLFRTESILQSIRLEIGTLAAWTPAVTRLVTPYIFEYYPKLAQIPSATVVTSTAERTFWEKATILHHEANRPEDTSMPMRYSRHYYDLYCIAKTEYKAAALKRLDLLQKVVIFKMKFYPRAWAKYEEAVQGTFKLIPPDSRLEVLRKDYETMSEMLFGAYPSFDELIDEIGQLEKEINKI
jgi:hypothetical protein